MENKTTIYGIKIGNLQIMVRISIAVMEKKQRVKVSTKKSLFMRLDYLNMKEQE